MLLFLMKTFKFNGHKVTVANGELHADDGLTQMMLAPLVKSASGGPEEGDPLLNLICHIFGRESVTDVVHDDPEGMVY